VLAFFFCLSKFDIGYAVIAQLVEQLTCNQQVPGSNPGGSSLVNHPTAQQPVEIILELKGSAMSEEIKAQQEAPKGDLWHGVDLNTCTPEDFWEVINPETGNPRAREEYINDQDKFASHKLDFVSLEQAMIKANQQQPAAPAPAQPESGAAPSSEVPAAQPPAGQQAPAAASPSEEMIDLTGIKIPKGLFGSYLTGRSIQEGIVALAEGNFEKDKAIASRDERLTKLSGKTITLQQELINATIKANSASAQPKAAPIPKIEVDEIDFSAIKAADLFDPDNHTKVRELIEKADAALKKVRQQITAVAQPPAEPTPYNPEADQDVIRTRNELAANQLQRDIFEIDTTASQIPQLRMSKPFEIVDVEVGQFYDRLKLASGIPGDRLESAKLFFGNSQDSKIFRDRCIAQGIVPPVDYDKHQIAYRAYNNRKKDIENDLPVERRGNPSSAYSMQRYMIEELAKSQPSIVPPTPGQAAPAAPSQPNPDVYRQTIDQHVQQQQARAVPPGVIPDIPPSAGGHLEVPNEARWTEIAKKAAIDENSLTKEEAILYGNLLMQQFGYTEETLPPIIKKKAMG
jgi:hypothetical protein